MGSTATGLVILGSTGSIGRQTLQVVRALSPRFRIVALAAGRNRRLLAEQVQEFRPRYYACQGGALPDLRGQGCERLSLEEAATLPEADTVVVATSGHAGLPATLAAARAGKRIALANKESLVMAGGLITAAARQGGACIIPVDSEHSAIWQCLRGEPQAPSRIILTASGGPFLNFPPERLANVTVAEALKHPSWQMGPKVTVDSATLMNKGLEVIEAHWLFDVDFDRVEVVIHPQSIVHSLVEFPDGSVKAQLGHPDMRLPIQYALTYPDRLPNPELPRISLAELQHLTFQKANHAAFPCLPAATEAGKAGGTMPAVLCGADEAAVDLFLGGAIRFTDIHRLVARVLAEHRNHPAGSLEDILEAARWAYRRTRALAGEGTC